MKDPLHQPGGPDTFWTTINAEENLAGVVDPLSGTFWVASVTVGTFGAFADMGVIPESQVVFPHDPDKQIVSLISGRYCVNVDCVRGFADLMPGTSGDAMERDLFGHARAGIPANRSLKRYPIVAVKAPGAALGVPKRINGLLPRSQAWWRRSIAELDGAGADGARALLDEAHDHMRAMMRPHTLGTMLIQGVLEQVRGLAERAGAPELELELSRGLGGLEEVDLLSQLWEISRGRGSLEEFVAVYGFHGPGESAVSATSWREDPSLLDPVIAAYSGMDESRSPEASASVVASKRAASVEQLLGALPAARRPGARFLLRFSDKLWALRETGKATYLHGIDVARAASRIVGRQMAVDGLIALPEDVNYLTIDELIDPASALRDWREEVDFRRARREEYLGFDVGMTWSGEPEPVTPEDVAGTGEIKGLPASPGVVEGPVRVITDPARQVLEEGEILICKTTDPSWSTLFLTASAAVIDVGAPGSHGAIISRELGLPCVINTRTATSTLRDGDRVRVDGGAGTVTVSG